MRLLPSILISILFLFFTHSSSNHHQNQNNHYAAADSPAPTPTAAEYRSAADLALAKGDLSSAISQYTKLIQLEPTQLHYFHRSNAYLKRHAYNNAVADLSKSIAADPKFVKGYFYRAKVQKIQGKCMSAVEDLNKVLELQSNHKEAREELTKSHQCAAYVKEAENSFHNNQFEQSKYFITQALEIAYDSHLLLLLRSRCHMAMGDYQSALIDTRKILQTDQTSIQALLLRGKAYYQLGEYENAQIHYKESLRQDPEHRETITEAKKLKLYLKYMNDGNKYIESKQYQLALTNIQSAIDMDLKENHIISLSLLYMKKSQILNGLKKGKESVESANESLKYDENNLDALIQRAEAKLLLEEWQDAVNDYTKAHQLDQNRHDIIEGLQKSQRLLKQSQSKDYYKELGVQRDSTDRQIKKAYHKLALQYHPDKLKDGDDKEKMEKKFREIAEAYEVLSDPETRGKYDRGEEIKPGQGGGQQQQGGFNPFGGGFGGFPGGGFNQHFGGGQQQGGQQFHFKFG